MPAPATFPPSMTDANSQFDAHVEANVRRQALIRALADRRRQLGISQTDLARAMGTFQPAIARLEGGGADPKFSTLERYAAALGLIIAWQLSEDQEHPGVAAVAARDRRAAAEEIELGNTLSQCGDLIGAKAAYLRAMEAGDPGRAAEAAGELGVLLIELGDIVGARAALERAIDSGERVTAPKAAFDLGTLLKDQGDFQGAKAAFEWAARSEHYDWAARARRQLLNLRASSPGH